MDWLSLFSSKPSVKSKSTPDEIIEGTDYRLRVRINPRAKRIGLRIDSKAGEVVLTLPKRAHRQDGLAFAHSRHDWILTHLNAAKPMSLIKPGQSITILGQTVLLEHRVGVISARLSEDGSRLISSGDEAQYARRILKYIKTRALEFAQSKTSAYAQKLGAADIKVTIIDAKSRWGSCTPLRKTIRLNWRLVFASQEVFDYVCAHEAAHLRHPDHSKAFWDCVHDIYGDYRPARKWLKTHGNDLHLIN